MSKKEEITLSWENLAIVSDILSPIITDNNWRAYNEKDPKEKKKLEDRLIEYNDIQDKVNKLMKMISPEDEREWGTVDMGEIRCYPVLYESARSE